MSKNLADLPNSENGDWAHDRLMRQLDRPGDIHAGKIEVGESDLADLLAGYRAYRLECAAQDANDFEGGDELAGYRKTAAVCAAWGVDVPEPCGRVRAAMAEEG